MNSLPDSACADSRNLAFCRARISKLTRPDVWAGFLVLSVIAGVFPPALTLRAGPPSQPNVLFIAVDDLNDWIGPLGGYQGTQLSPITPNMDRLAAKGMTFLNAHCASSGCHPCRVSVMTGSNPGITGISVNYQSNAMSWRTGPFSGASILANAVTLSQYFRNRGYYARGAGKIYHALQWNNDSENDYGTWDEYFDPPGSESDTGWQPLPNLPNPFTGWPGSPLIFFHWQALTPQNTWIASRPFLDSDMADWKIVSWVLPQLQAPLTQPLFQAVGIFRPHIPWHVPQMYFDLYPLEDIERPPVLANDLLDTHGHNRENWHQWILDQDSQAILPTQWEYALQGYLASITYADSQIGRLLDQLDANSGDPSRMNWDNTVVVLWSDHGMHMGEKRNWEKFTLWEETTRIPIFIAAPGVSTPGSSSTQPVSAMDLFPTLVELSGGSPADTHVLDGESLVPLLQNPHAARRMPALTVFERETGVRTARWRYIRYRDGGANGVIEELYDHAADPDEFTNLAPQAVSNPEIAAVIRRLSGWVDFRFRLPQGRELGADTYPIRPKVVGRPILICARINPNGGDGVIAAQGAGTGARGYSLYVENGRLKMAVKRDSAAAAVIVADPSPLPLGESNVFGWLQPDGICIIGANGEVKASGNAGGLFLIEPAEALSAGYDSGANVVAYANENFSGTIENLEITVHPFPDADDDRVSDGDELISGLDPESPDSDDDGFRDGVERDAGSDPGSAGSVPPPHVSGETTILIDFGADTLPAPGGPAVHWNNVNGPRPPVSQPDPALNGLTHAGTLKDTAGNESGITFAASATGAVGVAAAADDLPAAAPSSVSLLAYTYPSIAGQDSVCAEGVAAEYSVRLANLSRDFAYDLHFFGASASPGSVRWTVRGAGEAQSATLATASNTASVVSIVGVAATSLGEITIAMTDANGAGAGAARWNTLEIAAHPVPKVLIAELEPGATPQSYRLKWNSRSGMVYRVQATTDLRNWVELASAVAAQGSETSFEDDGAMALGAHAFYRVIEAPAPADW